MKNRKIPISSANFPIPGYGHISPSTFSGKLFCIGYALIGIPLLLVFMKDIGDLMGDGVRWMYR